MSYYYIENSKNLIPKHIINEINHFLSKAIYADLKGKELVLVTILNGGLIFSADLQRRLPIPFEVGYIHATRYVNDEPTEFLKIISEYFPKNLSEKTILLLDDIFDEGITLEYIYQYCLNDLKAKEVYSAVLLYKNLPERKTTYKPDYIGRKIENEYVFGYGMDLSGYWRGLEEVRVLLPKNFE